MPIIKRLKEIAARKPLDLRGLRLGDLVRIQLPRRVAFPHSQRYSTARYKIVDICKRQKPALFQLATLDEPPSILGALKYGRQLQRVSGTN